MLKGLGQAWNGWQVRKQRTENDTKQFLFKLAIDILNLHGMTHDIQRE